MPVPELIFNYNRNVLLVKKLTENIFLFYFKSYFNWLEFNIRPFVKILKYFFSKYIDLIEHKLCVKNQ